MNQKSLICKIIAWFLFVFMTAGNIASANDFHEDSPEPEESKVAWAARVIYPPKIDGYLDDSCWTVARPVNDFVQQWPIEGAPPSEETEVRIVYDDRSIYFCFICYDNEPDKIEAVLSPRDGLHSSDEVQILIDSFFDRRTAFRFGVNALNVKEDLLYTEDTRKDRDWNSVWYSNVRILDYGWVAEIEIPFNCLRFDNKPSYTWGLNLSRKIQRKKETVQWRMIPESESGFFVSRFGVLKGLKGIKPPLRFEFLPYGIAQLQDNEVMHNDFTRNQGLDIKYGPSSNITLDITLNPEFGTVETDEEKLNLTPFPTYYPEKRPFFLEFQDFFKTGIQLFHSRRIGKPLHNVVNPTTTISGGVRLVGKTEGGLRYGFIETLADEEKYFFLDEDGDGGFNSVEEKAYRRQEDAPAEERAMLSENFLEPRSNYFLGRLIKEFKNQSSLGVVATAANRKMAGRDYLVSSGSYTGGVDWDYRICNDWKFAGQLAGSATENAARKKEGYGLVLNFGKFNAEHLTYGVGCTSYSSDFDVNDLGWLYGNDYGDHSLNAKLELRGRPRSRGIRSYSVHWSLARYWTDRDLQPLEGKVFGNRFNTRRGLYTGGSMSSGDIVFGGNLEFMNYWSLQGGTRIGYDNEEDPFRVSRERDFIFVYPKTAVWYCNISNHYSSPVNIGIVQNYGTYRDGTRWKGGVSLRLRPEAKLELFFDALIDKRWDFSDFHTPNEVAGLETSDKILTLRRTKFESLVFRTSYTMTNKLDFRLFTQYTNFHSRRYKPLADDRFAIDSPIETSSTLGLHFVTRFEYRPGSYFYLVYRENRFDEEDGRGFGRPDRQLICKFTYLLKKSYL